MCAPPRQLCRAAPAAPCRASMPSPASPVMSWLCCQPWPHASASPAHTPSGDEAPRFVEPTVVAYHGAVTGTSGLRGGGKAAAAADPLADLDYSIGHAALANAAGSALTYPMKGGIISDFDSWCGRGGPPAQHAWQAGPEQCATALAGQSHKLVALAAPLHFFDECPDQATTLGCCAGRRSCMQPSTSICGCSRRM